jgi:hypothetical protein
MLTMKLLILFLPVSCICLVSIITHLYQNSLAYCDGVDNTNQAYTIKSYLRNYEKSKARMILIDGDGFTESTGGIEAMVQLVIALTAVSPPNTVFITNDYIKFSFYMKQRKNITDPIIYNAKHLHAYKDLLNYNTKSLMDLQPGDIHIISEYQNCNLQMPEGVHLYIYLLADVPPNCKKSSAKMISHNYYIGITNAYIHIIT